MKITPTVERHSDTLIITGRCSIGMGMSADYGSRHDVVKIVATEEFERLKKERKPRGYHDKGCNVGAPVDGLIELVGGTSGIRYLVDGTGLGVHYVYADASTVSEGKD